MDGKSDVPQKAERTEEHKEIMPGNITNEGLAKEKKEQLSPQESTIVTSVEKKNVTEKDDGLQKVERTEEIKEILSGNITNEVLVNQKEEQLSPQESTKVTSVERKNVTEKDDGHQKVERTEEIKEIMPGNITNEVLVNQKEEQLSPQESTIVTSVERKNVTEKDDGHQKVERTEEIKEIMPGNITNEVLVKQKEEQLSPQESTKVTSVERKNVTEKGDRKDVEKETVIQKEVEKNVCDSDIKEVRNEKHLNETIEDLKHQVDDVKNKIKEEKAKAEETNPTRSLCVVKEPSAAPIIQDGKVVEKIVPAVTPAKVAEKIHPTMTEGKVPVVTKEKVVEQAAPSVTEEIVSISKEQEKVPVMAEEKKVIEKIIPSVTEGKVPVVPQQEVVEKVAPSPTEEKVPVVTQERAIEQNAPQERVIEQAAPQERVIEQAAPQERVIEKAAPQERVIEQAAPQERVIEKAAPQERVIEKAAPQERVIEQAAPQERVIEQAAPQERVIEKAAPQERVIEQAAPQERVIEQAAPTATEEIVTVSKEKEEVPVVTTVTEGKVPVVTKEKVVEQAAPSVTEEIVSVSKEQEVPVVAEEKKVIEKIHPTMTEGKVPVVPQQEVVEKVAPSPTEEKVPVVTPERAIEQNAPQERVIEQAAPTATEEIATVSKEKEEVPVVVTEEKVPVVTNETVIEKITPSVTEEKDVNQRKVVSYEDATENQENQVTGDEETDKTELKFIVTIQERIVREQTVSIIPVMDKGANKRPNRKLVKKEMRRVAKKVGRAVLEELSKEHSTAGEGQ
ncbi:probable serine/threonine-protein kinase kinX isoform X7 [Eriocheir sinensis]|uniref:probable serine/threonine-protein kinase kinX isoform X7 n=1 Tax=Eriocheir sinensis TaxID=95602 RepID=UPI0021C96FA1|nr:probable serine/threonine-protein kinase kinX isoform X7 [Eriocheir sinensis]